MMQRFMHLVLLPLRAHGAHAIKTHPSTLTAPDRHVHRQVGAHPGQHQGDGGHANHPDEGAQICLSCFVHHIDVILRYTQRDKDQLT